MELNHFLKNHNCLSCKCWLDLTCLALKNALEPRTKLSQQRRVYFGHAYIQQTVKHLVPHLCVHRAAINIKVSH